MNEKLSKYTNRKLLAVEMELPNWTKPKPIKNNKLDEFLEDQKLSNCMVALQYKFKEPNFLLEALWHKSLNIENIEFNYERLEFLGDSILQFYAGIKLFNQFPEFQEGELTKSLSNIVSTKPLSMAAKELNLDKFIFITDSLKSQISDSILADVFESIIASIYADGGINEAINFLDRTLLNLFIEPLTNAKNYKSYLQEWTQKLKTEMPEYEVIEQEGPEHELIFKVIIHVNNNTFGPVSAKSKKDAEQQAAKLALEHFKLL